jgi:hypothetical protein
LQCASIFSFALGNFRWFYLLQGSSLIGQGKRTNFPNGLLLTGCWDVQKTTKIVFLSFSLYTITLFKISDNSMSYIYRESGFFYPQLLCNVSGQYEFEIIPTVWLVNIWDSIVALAGNMISVYLLSYYM